MKPPISQSQQTETALRQSEARFQRIIASVPGVIYQFLRHPDGSVTFPFVSPRCHEIFEVEAMEIQSDADVLISMIDPEDVESFNQSIALSIETLQLWQWEGRFILPDGSLKWIQCDSTPEWQTNGDILWDGFFLDITARKQAEEALRESEGRFRRLVEQAADSIILHDLQGKILDVNQQTCSNLGYTREELLTLSVSDIEENFVPGVMWQHMERGAPTTVNGKQRRKDGTNFPVEVRLGVLEFRGERLILALCRDITERKQAELERDRTQRFLNSLLENLPLAVFAKDAAQLRFIFWNKMSTRLLGYSSDEALGKGSHDVFSAEVAEFCIAKDREVLASGEPLNIPNTLLETPHQGQRIIRTIKVPVPDEAGTPQYLLGIMEDITERKQTETALRQSQERLQTVMTSAPLILFSINCQGIFTLCEGKGLEAIGCQSGELVGLSIYKLCRDNPEFIEYFNRAIGGEQLDHIIVNFADMVFDIRYAIIRDEMGEVISITSIALDITERHKAKIALQESEAKFRSIVENANDIIYQLTPDGVFSYVSPNWVDLLGHEVTEVEGKVFTPFIHPDDLPLCLGALGRAIEKGQKQSGIEYRVRHKNGFWRWHTSNLSVLRDGNGKVLSLVGIARDISERKLAEEALQESEERFRNLVESTHDFIWEIDENAVYTYVSPQVKDILGYEIKEVLGKTTFDLMPPDEACSIIEKISNHVALRLPLTNVENINIHKNGHTVILETSGVAFFDQKGNFQGYRGIGRDITKRKQTEEAIKQSKAQLLQQATQLKQTLHQLQSTQAQLIQTEKMSSLGQLVAGVAHEINNPINFIYGNINHAKNYVNDILNMIAFYREIYLHNSLEAESQIEEIDLDFIIEDFPKLLNSMEVGAERVRGIVSSLRTFSRLDESAVKDADIHQGIDSAIILLQSRLKPPLNSQTIQIVKEYANLPLIKCYPGDLNQVFMNLLNNAIDALEDRKRCNNYEEISATPSIIKVRTEMNSGSVLNPLVVIRIIDNGIGMTEEVRSKSFDPFFTTKPVGQGTGLGLAVSYQIVVELHKGRLYCISSPGKGTEFVIEIPVQ